MPEIKRSAGHKDAARGDILWLNPWPSDPIVCSKPVHDIFNHPVMILWLDEAGDQACVLILSSLGGKDLKDYGSKAVRKVHIPIDPSPAHPDTGELLYLKGGLQLQKTSYIKIKTRYRVSASLIRSRYCDFGTGKRYQLRSDSLAVVNEAVDAGIDITDGMASSQISSGALNQTFTDHMPVRVHDNLLDYGSSRQNIPKISRPVEPTITTWPKKPLRSSIPKLHSHGATTLDSNVQRVPAARTRPEEPLSSRQTQMWPHDATRSSSGLPRHYTWQKPWYQQRITSETSRVLPIHTQSRSHHISETTPLLSIPAQSPALRSGWPETLAVCSGFLILVLFVAFMYIMAYWIHRLGG